MTVPFGTVNRGESRTANTPGSADGLGNVNGEVASSEVPISLALVERTVACIVSPGCRNEVPKSPPCQMPFPISHRQQHIVEISITAPFEPLLLLPYEGIGDGVGACADVGRWMGRSAPYGCIPGHAVGAIGLAVGPAVGLAVGSAVGSTVGFAIGSADELAVGLTFGLTEGLAVGLDVGLDVGFEGGPADLPPA